MQLCEFCNRQCATSSSYKNHVRRCPDNKNRIVEKKTEQGRRRISEAAKKENAKRWTPEVRKKHSRAMHKAVQCNPDSYTKNNVSGRTKIVEYNGVRLKGSWEVKVAKWLTLQNVAWQSEVNPQPYFWKSKYHTYFPDFYISHLDLYIEVKGYKTDRDDAKWSQFKGILVIIDLSVIKTLEEYSLDEIVAKQKFRPYSSV